LLLIIVFQSKTLEAVLKLNLILRLGSNTILYGQRVPEFRKNLISKFKVNITHYPIVEMV